MTPRKRPTGLRRPSSDDPQGIVDKAIGKFDRERLNNAVRANRRLADRIESVFEAGNEDYYWNELPFGKNYHFSPEDVRRYLPELRACGTSFSDGSPNEVCRHPFLCQFCSHSRGDSVHELYRRSAFGRLGHNKHLTVLQGAILHKDPVTGHDIHDCIRDLKEIGRNIRDRVNDRCRDIRRGKSPNSLLSEVDLYQLDFFIHVSAKGLTIDGLRLYPHLHVVIQPTSTYATGQVPLDVIQSVVERTPYRYEHHRKAKINEHGSGSYLSAFRYSRMGFYGAVMLKHDMPSDGKLHAIASLPEGFRQISRKKDSPEIEQSFANTKPRGKHNAHFDFKRDNWVADVE